MLDSTTTTARDPAVQASSLLLRLGLFVLLVLAPAASVPSRRLFLVLAPLGIALVFLSAMLDGRARRVAVQTMSLLMGPAGVAACFLLVWAALSLLWTPFPAAGLDRLAKSGCTVLLTLCACTALPERMRASNLYLVTIGVAAAAFFTLAAVVYGTLPQRAFDPEQPTLDRALAGISVGVFAAVGWLVTKGRPFLAALFAAIVIGVAVAAQANDSLVALGVGAVVLGAGRLKLHWTALFVAIVTAGLVLFAPLIGIALGSMVDRITWLDATDIAGLRRWATVVVSDPARVLTGRGIETAVRARFSIAYGAPRSILFEIWYELGLLGASTLAVLAAAAALSTVRLGAAYGAFVLAGLAAVFVHLILGSGTTQTWWTTTLCVYAVAFVAVRHGQYRSVRPRAAVRSGSETGRLPSPVKS